MESEEGCVELAVLGLQYDRRVAYFGGTSTMGNCLVALRYLASPRQLPRGPAIVEYEEAFARQIGVQYAYSLFAGRRRTGVTFGL